MVRRKLFGRVMHLETAAGRSVRRLVNYPDRCSFSPTDADVAALKIVIADLGLRQVVDLLRAVRAGLSPVQADALSALVEAVETRYLNPEWKEDGTVQLHLDAWAISGSDRAWPKLLEAVDADVTVAARTGDRGRLTFGVTSHHIRGGHAMMLLTFRPEVLCGIVGPVLNRGDVTALAVKIGPRQTEVKAVVSARPSAMLNLAQATALVGRDFGYANTCSWSVVRIPAGALTQERVALAAQILAMRDGEAAKALCREYLGTHGSTVVALEQRQHSVRAFLDAVYGHCQVIDACKGTVDETYDNIRGVKKVITDGLWIPADTRIDLEADHADPHIAGLVRRLGRQLASVATHKARRRRAYEAIDGLKRSWFGWVSNQEVELSKGHPGAALVRQGLDNVTNPLNDPRYKGGTFNRMFNAGARGRYAGCAGDKFSGTTSGLAVPSFYTSTTDHRHAVVDSTQRKGDTFTAVRYGAKWQADLHAAHTIALWPVMGQVRCADGGKAGGPRTEVAEAA